MTQKGEKIYSLLAKIFAGILVLAVLFFIYAAIFDEDLMYIPIVMAICVCVLSLPSGAIIKRIYRDEE